MAIFPEIRRLARAATWRAGLSALALAGLFQPAFAAPEKYMLDPGHSQILFSYNHLGFSTTWGMFAGFGGEIMYDREAPKNSSVTVSFPVGLMYTGWEPRREHFMSPDFFKDGAESTVRFTSTAIEVTGENTGRITGDLTLNGITRPVVLEAQLNQEGTHPMENKPWLGFSATTMVKRSDFGLGMFAPYVSDEVEIRISIEAGKAE